MLKLVQASWAEKSFLPQTTNIGGRN